MEPISLIIAAMDRVFSRLSRIQKLMSETQRYFLLRIKNNIRLEMLDDCQFLLQV